MPREAREQLNLKPGDKLAIIVKGDFRGRSPGRRRFAGSLAAFTLRITSLTEPHHFAVTSALTMTDILTRPYAAGATRQANENYALLSNDPHLEWIAPDLVTADLAAQFRSKYRMRTPHAIQAATAVRSSASGFISNDRVFERVKGFEALTWDDLL